MNEMTNPPAIVARAEADSTAARLAQLRELGHQAGELLYDRVTLAGEVLADSAWVDVQGGYDRALDTLQDGYFPDLKGTSEFTLDHLLVLLEEFPAKEQWRERKWSVKKLWAEYELRRSRPKEPPKATHQPPVGTTQAVGVPADETDRPLGGTLPGSGADSTPASRWQTAGYTPAVEETLLPTPEQDLIDRLRGENERLRSENRELKKAVKKYRKQSEKLQVELRQAKLRPGV